MKVYISRDEDDDFIWLWKKPHKGNWRPSQLKECDMVNFQRPENMDEWDTHDCYHVDDFKKKFGIRINKKTCKCVHLPDSLVNNDKLKMFTVDTIEGEKDVNRGK